MTKKDGSELELTQYASRMYETLVGLLDSIEPYFALTKPREEWDEYDYMINPRWIAAKELVDEISAENRS